MEKSIPEGMTATLERMLTTLEMKVKPSHTALIVVDMQNDFCAKGGIFNRDGMDISMIQAMAPRLTHFIGMAREIRVAIVYIQTIYYSPNSWYLSDVWLEQRKRRGRRSGIEEPACEQNSWGADFYDGIKPLPGEAVVNKHRFSAFLDTDLDLILRSKGIRTLIMTGVATDVCVETTARDGFMRDYYIVFLRDCTASTSEERHRNTLKNIEIYFGEVVDSTDVLGCWKLRG